MSISDNIFYYLIFRWRSFIIKFEYFTSSGSIFRRQLMNNIFSSDNFKFSFTTAYALILAGLISAGPSGAAGMDSINIYGYFDLGYNITTGNRYSKSGPNSPNLKNGAFDQRHLNILTDIMVSPNVALRTHVEFEHGIHPSADSASVVMEYGFGEYTYSDTLKIRGGKMLSPYGIYSEIHDATPAYLAVSPPETFYRAEFKGGHMVVPKWSTGLAILGELSLFSSRHDVDYVIYVGNGESRFTTNESEQDDNPNKSLGARLQFISAGEVLVFGVSGFMGDRALSLEEMRVPHIAMTSHLSLTWKGANLTGEFGRSQMGSVTEITWYVQASVRVGRVTPYARVQVIDPNDTTPDDFWTVMLGGVNIRVTDAMFVKMEWDENQRGKRNTDIISGESRNFGEFRAAVTLMF